MKSFSLSLMASNVTLMLSDLVLIKFHICILVSQISYLHFQQPMETLHLETLLSLHVQHIQKVTHNFPYLLALFPNLLISVIMSNDIIYTVSVLHCVLVYSILRDSSYSVR